MFVILINNMIVLSPRRIVIMISRLFFLARFIVIMGSSWNGLSTFLLNLLLYKICHFTLIFLSVLRWHVSQLIIGRAPACRWLSGHLRNIGLLAAALSLGVKIRARAILFDTFPILIIKRLILCSIILIGTLSG